MTRIVDGLIADFRYSARRLFSRPAYVLLAVLTLALGAGGTAAIFSVARPLLLQPLPYARESELGALWHEGDWTEQEFLYLRPKFPGFQGMTAYMETDATLDVPGEPLRLVHGVAASAEMFDVLGARPLLGRTFRAGDDLQGAEPVTVLSYRQWQELGGDPAILGRRLQLGGATRTVVGVMPRNFWFPHPDARIWMATPLRPDNRVGNYTLVGRIEPSRRMDRMQEPLQAIAASLKQRFTYSADWDKTKSPSIQPVRQALVGNVRPALLATLVAMLLILSMSCVNVAALMLGQVGGRTSELAVRTALGAGRARLVQQLVIEALLIGALAGITGGFLASLGFELLVRALPLGSLAEAATLDWTVLVGATLIAQLAALFIALIPALVVWRGDLRGSIGVSRTSGSSGRGGKLESGLVIAQVALAVLLAVGAGLLLKTVGNLHRIDPGLRVDGRAVVDATLPAQLNHEERRRAILDLLSALRALPDVRAVAATQQLPLRGTGNSWGLRIEGKPDLEASTTYFRIVTQDYFKTLGVRVLRGRDFSSSDQEGAERVVLINQALAAKYFPGEEPIGRILHTGFGDQGERVIGVVGNVSEAYLTDHPVPARYMLYEQIPFAPEGVTYVLAASSPSALPRVLQAARNTVRQSGRQLALERTDTMKRVFEEAVGAPGQVAVLLSLLAVLALLLGAIGVYGMISQFVARRARDYGIRMALGLSADRVVSHVLGRGMRLVGIGSALGIVAALFLTRLLASLLYGVRAADPLALASAVVVLLLVGSLAALIPARRASRTDPVAVLREQ